MDNECKNMCIMSVCSDLTELWFQEGAQILTKFAANGHQGFLSTLIAFHLMQYLLCHMSLLLYFRDRASHNDVIGTTHLGMSKISAPGGEIDGKKLVVTGLNPTSLVCTGLDWNWLALTARVCLYLTYPVWFG